MQKAATYKSKQFLFLLIKLSIVFGATYFIYYRLTNNDLLDFQVFINLLNSKKIITFTNIVLLITFSIANWFFEVLKWKTVVSPVKSISFSDSVRQSLGALTASLFTPNKIGEYGAKALYFEKKLRKKIVLLTLINNLGQLFATLLFGSVGFSFFLRHYPLNISLNRIYLILAFLLFLSGFVFWFIKQKKYRINGVPVEKLKAFLKKITLKVQLANIAFSLVRYLIFSHQFYFLLFIFGVQAGYWEMMAAISTVYLLTSAIPMLFIFDVLVKGSVAVWVFGFWGVNELSVLSVITLMWLLNFVFPAVAGSYYVLNFSFNPVSFNEKEIADK
ncbi:hypothetical protein GWK08_04980 [Leptobacterium flavescens]|uniref:Flippase-like domain-containing protein n=1 Tax=Leptobacterium flavescens TaxID=472055 RepID=A0A6P0UJQ3_9FLAO|nr:lysylphosphatidylglycerol synthase domain-containing protein [Leptobacterium flavescens]NER12782.1 hypothetical protein [Leptobacterium flavescens]